MTVEETQNIPTETVVEVPEPVVEVVPVEEPLKFYEWQPTDEEGRPIGGKQVIKYRTQEEFAAEFSKSNTHLLRKLRETTRKLRLGIDDEIIPENAERRPGVVSFTPVELSNDELFQIGADLHDPSKSISAQRRLVESAIGAPLEVLGSTLKTLQDDNYALKANLAANAFMDATPDYFPCMENSDALTGWITRHELAPTYANFSQAYVALREAGILVDRPVATSQNTPIPAPEPEPVQVVVPAVVPPVVPPVPPVVTRRIPTGLNNENTSSDSQIPPKGIADDIVYEIVVNGQKRTWKGEAAINAMPADEFRKRVKSDRSFATIVEKLEAEKAKRNRPRSEDF